MKQSLQKITAWAKKNPLLAALILGGVILAAWWVTRNRGSSDQGVAVSAIPESTPIGQSGGGGGEIPTPTPSPYDVPIPIPVPGGGGGGRGRGGGGGSGSSSSPYSSPASPIDESMLLPAAGTLDRTAAENYWQNLTSEEQTSYQGALPYLFSSPEGGKVKTGGKSSGLKGESTTPAGSSSSGPAGSAGQSNNLSKLSRTVAEAGARSRVAGTTAQLGEKASTAPATGAATLGSMLAKLR